MTQGPADPDRAAGGEAGLPVFEHEGRVDQRDAFGLTSPRGMLRVADGILSWQPRGWGAPVWLVPCADVIGGAASGVPVFELWLDTPVTGTVAVCLEPPGGRWAATGNVPDLRGQQLLDRLVAGLRDGGARIAGNPRSLSSLPGTAGGGVFGPFGPRVRPRSWVKTAVGTPIRTHVPVRGQPSERDRRKSRTAALIVA